MNDGGEIDELHKHQTEKTRLKVKRAIDTGRALGGLVIKVEEALNTAADQGPSLDSACVMLETIMLQMQVLILLIGDNDERFDY